MMSKLKRLLQLVIFGVSTIYFSQFSVAALSAEVPDFSEPRSILQQTGNISLIYPVEDTGNQWYISQGYNTYYHGGNDSNRADLMALDITEYGNSEGRNVLAAASGEVWYVNTSQVLCSVVLKHESVFTTYLHVMPAQNLEVGQSVNVGAIIGTMQLCGGISSGAHVHFMLNQWVGSGDPQHEFPYQSEWEALPFLDLCNDSYSYLGDESENQFVGTNITPCSANQPPQQVTLTTPANGEWLNTDTPTLRWTPGPDDGVPNPSPDYRIQIDNSSDFSSPVVDTGWDYTGTSLTTSALTDGTYYWRVNQSDGDLNSGWTAARTFGIDTTSPTAGCTLAGSSNGSGWYTSDVTVRCYSSDNGSGLASSSYTLDGVSQSAEFTVSAEGAHTVGYTAVDNVGNQTSGELSASIDRTAPIINAFSINQGAEHSFNVNVRLAQESSDAHSGVHEVRISNNALLWSDWQTNQAILAWAVPPYNRLEHTVYLQVRDVAGNESMLATDSIFLDLYPLMPHSANYRICNDVINVAGSTTIASSNYSLVSSIGQPVANASDSGFLADVAGCLPTEYLSGDEYALINSVVASGGGLRSSSDYRLGDTVGETAASPATAFSSSSYTLTSGFWSNTVAQPQEPPVVPENFIYLPIIIKK